MINADMEELAITEGLGTKKVKDIYYTFHKPFKSKKQSTKTNAILSSAVSSSNK